VALSAPWQQIAVSGIEHDSVRAPAAQVAAQRGARKIDIPVSGDGTAVYKTTALDSGALSFSSSQQRDGRAAGRSGSRTLGHENGARLHTDAVQAPGRVASISARSALRP